MADAVVFPGQGAQKTGMAQDFHDTSPVARAVFAEASEAVSIDLAALCFTPDPRLSQTAFTQPAILTAEVAMFRTLQAEHGWQPRWFGGHSLGEYTALVAAGVLPLAEAVDLVHARGTAMQAAVPLGQGAMAALLGRSIDVAAVRACIGDRAVDLANHNSADQVVLSGVAADVDAVCAALTEADTRLRVRVLPVSAPFHSRLMAPIEPAFRSRLQASAPTWTPASAPTVLCNVDGGWHAATTDTILDRLTRQISGPVQWVSNMHTLAAAHPTRIVEVGPGRPLRGFFRSIGVGVVAVTNRVSARRAFAEG